MKDELAQLSVLWVPTRKGGVLSSWDGAILSRWTLGVWSATCLLITVFAIVLCKLRCTWAGWSVLVFPWKSLVGGGMVCSNHYFRTTMIQGQGGTAWFQIWNDILLSRNEIQSDFLSLCLPVFSCFQYFNWGKQQECKVKVQKKVQ